MAFILIIGVKVIQLSLLGDFQEVKDALKERFVDFFVLFVCVFAHISAKSCQKMPTDAKCCRKWP